MKKLMIAAAAALCATVSSQALESANVVGYVTYSLTGMKQDIGGVPFLNAGGGELDIQNIKLSNGTDGGDWLMVFNPATRTYNTYTWYAMLYDADDNELGYSGWGEEEYIVDATIQPGQGFWIQTQLNNTVTFTSVNN